MPIDSPASASDSSENVDLGPQFGGIPEHGDKAADSLQMTQEKLRNIFNLMIATVQGALQQVILEEGGNSIVWGALNKSGYKNFRALCTDLVDAVACYHAKLAARDNLASGDLLIHQEELKGTLRRVLHNAFSNHGQYLHSFLAGLKIQKTT